MKITLCETSFRRLPNLRGGLADIRGGALPPQALPWLRASCRPHVYMYIYMLPKRIVYMCIRVYTYICVYVVYTFPCVRHIIQQ